MKPSKFSLYAWKLSWYSGKIRPYLRFKEIDFVEVAPSLWTFYRVMPRRGGASGVPVLVTPEGEWITDSSVIVERMEARFPTPAVIPFSPRQRFFVHLMEMWFDEFWHPTAIHTRWNFPENFPNWQAEIGTGFVPWLPRFMRDRIAGKPRDYMLKVTRAVGATADQIPLIERWSDTHLDALDRHFARMPFLLGTRPSLADFALSGPIWGHFLFDVVSFRTQLQPRRHLHDWLKRIDQPLNAGGAFLADDAIPDSLELAVRSVFDEMVPYLEGCLRDVQAFMADPASRERMPRFGSQVRHPYGGSDYARVALPYALWMAQRTLDVLQTMSPEDAAGVREWVRAAGGERFLELKIPRLRRIGYQVAPEIARARLATT